MSDFFFFLIIHTLWLFSLVRFCCWLGLLRVHLGLTYLLLGDSFGLRCGICIKGSRIHILVTRACGLYNTDMRYWLLLAHGPLNPPGTVRCAKDLLPRSWCD